MTTGDWIRLRPFFVWIYLWVAWNLVCFLGSSQSAVATQVLITRIEMALIFTFLLILFTNHIQPQTVGRALAITAVFGAVMVLQDFMVPTYSSVTGRGAGFYVNPNIAAFILVQLMILAIPYLYTSLRWPFVILVSVAVFVTFARAGWLVLFISIIYLFWFGHLGFRRMRAGLGLAAILLVGLLGYGILSGALVEFLLTTSLAEHLDKNTLARLGMASFASDFSADERAGALEQALSAFAGGGHPFLGLGLGYTFEWDFPASTHNMYVLYLVEGGLLGLAVYLTLIILLFVRSDGLMRLITFNIAIYSFFSHNILDSPARLIIIALVATQLLQGANTHFSENKHA